MKTIPVYELIQWLAQFDYNDKLTIKNNKIYIIDGNAEVTEDDIEEYEKSIENSNIILNEVEY